MENKKISSRKRKMRSLSLATTIIVIVIMILLNTVSLLLAERFPQLNIDMTKERLYDFSDETKELIGKLEDETEIIVFATEAELATDIKNQVIVQMLKKITGLSDKLSIKFLDKYKNQGLAAKYDLYSTNANVVNIVVDNKANGNYKTITFDDLMMENQQYYNVEYAICTSIIINSKDELLKVAFINGHGESIPYSFVNLMEDMAYQTGSVTLNQLDDTIDYIVMYAPSTDITLQEAEILSGFLFNDGDYGRHAFIFYGEKTPKMPNLEKVLADYGLAVNYDIVLDGVNGVAGDPTQIYTAPVHETIGSTLVDRQISIPIYYSRSITQLFDEKDISKTEAVLASSGTAYTKPLTETVGQNLSKDENDVQGSYLIAAKGRKVKFIMHEEADAEPSYSSIFVSGAASIVDDAYMTGSYGNRKLLMDAINSTQTEYASFYGDIKEAITANLNVTTSNLVVINIIIFGVIPVIILLFGIIMFVKRRNK
ncbi:MAG: GldG family protein [Clostridia bacterium]|nr:GldG family protein [Clostridia bacterium]